MSLLHRVGETCFYLMPFVSQKGGFFCPYLVQMATFGISSYFWSFQHAFFEFVRFVPAQSGLSIFIMLFSDLF